jgi:mono/diheme cytochrome c family protein
MLGDRSAIAVVLVGLVLGAATSAWAQTGPTPRPDTPVPAAIAEPTAVVGGSAEPNTLEPNMPTAPLGVALPPPMQQLPSQPPDDPRLAKVYNVFQTHCAQCHQSDRLTAPAPSGGFANILDLEAVAREPHLVRPSEPDSSPLYHVLLDRHRPHDLARDGVEPVWPNVDDIQTVRTWISEMERTSKGCKPSNRLAKADVARIIDSAALVAGETVARDTRVVSLTHFANACTSSTDMQAYRDGVAKLLNSLSWGARPVALTPLDEGKTLLAFQLSDLGWIEEHWDALTRNEPKATALDLSGLLSAPGAHARPIRGDWLAMAASTPPFYAELLGLPPTLSDAERLLGINRDVETAGGRAMRAAIKSSQLTRGPRMMERYQVDARRMWLVHDYRDSGSDRDIFERPLYGVRGATDAMQVRPDGSRMIFGLPNGFLAFAALDADGKRVDQLAPKSDSDVSGIKSGISAGLACMSCHSTGLKPFADGVRAHVGSDKFIGSRDVKDKVAALYPASNEWSRVVDDDGYRYRRAMIQAGINPDTTLHGLDVIAALARRYNLSVDLATTAAELGVSPTELSKEISAKDLPDRSLAARLQQGLLSRSEVNMVMAALRAPKVAANPTTPGDAPLPTSDPLITGVGARTGLRLALWTDQSAYKVGDLMTVYLKASGPCHLTVLSIDISGKATVLFPNEFEPDNLISDKLHAVPQEKSAYQFRLRERGWESIVAVCQEASKLLAGIEPDYERQRFTSLGNFENFLRTSLGLEADERRVATRSDRARTAKPAAKDPASKDTRLDARTDAKPEPSARAAVRVQVE